MFTEDAITYYEEDEHYSFIDDLRNIFNKETNYDVEKELRAAGVIEKNPSVSTDTEHSGIYVYFATKDTAVEFVKRLNRYIEFLKSLRHNAPVLFRILILQ